MSEIKTIIRKCPHCKRINQLEFSQFDVYKNPTDNKQSKTKRYYVECRYCHNTFIILVPEEENEPDK
jgi:hypothetical protein